MPVLVNLSFIINNSILGVISNFDAQNSNINTLKMSA